MVWIRYLLCLPELVSIEAIFNQVVVLRYHWNCNQNVTPCSCNLNSIFHSFAHLPNWFWFCKVQQPSLLSTMLPRFVTSANSQTMLTLSSKSWMYITAVEQTPSMKMTVTIHFIKASQDFIYLNYVSHQPLTLQGKKILSQPLIMT